MTSLTPDALDGEEYSLLEYYHHLHPYTRSAWNSEGKPILLASQRSVYIRTRDPMHSQTLRWQTAAVLPIDDGCLEMQSIRYSSVSCTFERTGNSALDYRDRQLMQGSRLACGQIWVPQTHDLLHGQTLS